MVAFTDLAGIFDALRAGLPASTSEPLGPSRPAADYLPTQALLQQRIADGTVDATSLLLDMLLTVAPRWIEVQAGGIDELERVHVHAQAMAGTSVTVPPGLDYRYNNYAFRLSLDVTASASGGAVAMRALAEADGSRLDSLLARLTGTAARAAEAVMALRRFDDVLIRVLAARRAEQDTGLPVARIVTLHRLEGNLCVFPSDASLELGVPSAAGVDIPAFGAGREPTLINATMRPSFGHLVWLADEAAARAKAGTEDLPTFALSWAFMLQTIGGDRVASGLGVTPLIDHFSRWSTDNRMATGAAKPYTSRLTEAQARWRALLDQLVTKPVQPHDGSPGQQALRMAPRDPVAFLAGVLAEGAMYQEALGSGALLVGAPTALRVPEGLAAARYNWQATPEGTAATIYSALSAARTGGAGALRTAIRTDAAVTALLKNAANDVQTARAATRKRTKALPKREQDQEMNKAMRTVQSAAITVSPPSTPLDPDYADSLDQLRLRPEVRDWLLRDDHLERLGRYFDRAGTNVWFGYPDVRRYGMTARRLHEFYARVFP
jgi:hypothetical protein